MASVPGTGAPRGQPDVPILHGEEAFRLLVDAVSDYAIFLLDADGHVLTWNRGAERIKGYRADEIIGQHFSRFYTPEDRAINRPMTLLASAAQHGRFEDEGWRVRRDGSHFWADVIVTALRGPDGTPYGYAKVTRDLTERRAAEARERQLLVEQKARLVAEQALQTRDRFLSIASHELKTPVASLQLATESLVRAHDAGRLDDARLEASLARLTVSTQRLGALVSELLDVSRLSSQSDALSLVETDLSALAADVVARFVDAENPRVRLDAATPVLAEVDASRIDQVLTNLIDNALKYSDAPAEIVVAIGADRDEAIISVTDSGIGLDVAQDRIFRAFGRGENVEQVQGMGLGLFISRRIVQRHEGRIEIATRPDAPGTVATVWLPRRPGPA